MERISHAVLQFTVGLCHSLQKLTQTPLDTALSTKLK